ncbi:thiamine pyrophosphate-dependent dehydrogenase E1 component subunit alpha [Amycolatopsis sp. NPDC003676]
MTTTRRPGDGTHALDAPPQCLSDEDLRSLLLIRQFELGLLELFSNGELHGTTHTCLGQEYIPVALARSLRDDYVVSNHRGHGHYLARHDDPEGLLAELMGRAGGVCNGVGGSQHLHRRNYLSTGVQGHSLPVAVGIALHARDNGENQVVAVFVGDGTWAQGSVYEGLNMASLWNVPLVVVVENNGIAQSTPSRSHTAGSIADRAAAFGIGHAAVRTQDVAAVREQVEPLISAVRESHRPIVIEFETQRLGPHSKGDDTRDAETVADLWARDWSARYRDAFPEQWATVERQQRERFTTILGQVQAAAPAVWSGT